MPTDADTTQSVTLIEASSSHTAQDELDYAELNLRDGVLSWDSFKLAILHITTNHSI